MSCDRDEAGLYFLVLNRPGTCFVGKHFRVPKKFAHEETEVSENSLLFVVDNFPNVRSKFGQIGFVFRGAFFMEEVVLNPM